ncbi:MAG: hypothetical protein ACK40K_05670 [Raineya sp.]
MKIYFLLLPIHTGKQIHTANSEASIPPMLPKANENQKTSLSPSKRKGTNPKMLVKIVMHTGTNL